MIADEEVHFLLSGPLNALAEGAPPPKVRAFAVSIVLVMFASIVWLLTGLSGAASIPPPLTVHNLPCNSLIAIDEWGVQFVSVTQKINTATSAGRMMLNILITFTQYEREVITERVRDKMAASRKKGMWVGGSVPMGYKVENKHLVVVPEEADVIRKIFNRYVEIQSPKLIAMELNAQGIKTKQGKTWDKAHVYRILENHTYIGEVKYKDAICKGEQEAIIPQDLWNRAKAIRESAAPCPDRSRRQETIAPLKNILRCGHCEGLRLRCAGAAPDAACPGDRPRRPDGRIARRDRGGGPAAVHAGLVVGTEETA